MPAAAPAAAPVNAPVDVSPLLQAMGGAEQKGAADAPADAAAGEAPLEISADKGLEWNRAAKTYTARGAAVAKQGDMQVKADVLTASYSGADQSAIENLLAEGAVVLSSPPYEAYGARATYDVVAGKAILTGGDLRIVTPGETLTARDSIEFYAADNRLVAKGDARATRGTDRLSAREMTATFTADAAGKRALDQIVATGDVVITTAREEIRGEKGVYNAAQGTAQLTGKVRILQGENWLEGTRATLDLKSGVSKLFGDGNKETQGRVRGVFYPKSGKPAPVAAPPAAAETSIPPAPAVAPAAPVSSAPAAAPLAPAPAAMPSVDAMMPAPRDAVPAAWKGNGAPSSAAQAPDRAVAVPTGPDQMPQMQDEPAPAAAAPAPSGENADHDDDAAAAPQGQPGATYNR